MSLPPKNSVKFVKKKLGVFTNSTLDNLRNIIHSIIFNSFILAKKEFHNTIKGSEN